VIAGTKSDSGKTTLTLGLLAALKRRGYKLAPFKVGPDFIDPGHHAQIVGTKSRNLDGWMLSKQYNLNNFAKNSATEDIALIEGVMGLFDGYDGRSEAGSTAQIAKWLGAPVLLIVDARSMARSAAALVKGFEQFDPDLNFAGVVFNHIGSPRHLNYLEEALMGHVLMPCLGGVMREESITIPKRHLGLVTKEDHHLDQAYLDRLADLTEKSLAMNRLLEVLPQISPIRLTETTPVPDSSAVSIGVAQDAAFCFYYPENLELLARYGVQIKFFSPIKDHRLPQDIDGIYLGGGYPELYVKELTENSTLRKEIKENSKKGMPIYGECGGLMYLGDAIFDLNGQRHPMTGCLPFTTRMLPHLKRLGYREIKLVDDTLLGPCGTVMRGHEFHYSEIVADDASLSTLYSVKDRIGKSHNLEGYQVNRTIASYIHLHWGSCPKAAETFATICRQYQSKRTN
jgi:cobyrinic acid a,c-diamide synthase